MKDTAVYFPNMLEQMATGPVPDGVLFFDPGCTGKVSKRQFKPETLPLSPAAARRYVSDFQAFGEQFSQVRDLGYFKVCGVENFYSGSRMDIGSELSATEEEKKRKDADVALVKAQGGLLLAIALEERLWELNELDGRLGAEKKNFHKALGLDMDDEEGGGLISTTGVVHTPAEPENQVLKAWRRIFEMMAAFVPEELPFLTLETAVVEDLQEDGIEFFEVEEQEDGEGPKRLTATAPGWKIAGYSALPVDKDWLQVERTLFFCEATA